MKKSQSFVKLLFCISLLVSVNVLGVLPSVFADGKSASLPLRTVGDEWKFVVDYKANIGLICNMTTTVTGTTTLSQSGNNYECFEFTSLGNGTVYGANVSGTWSISIKEYYGKSDFSLAKMSITQDVTIIRPNGTTITTQDTETIYNPPFGINSGFPLSLGKTWSAASAKVVTNTVNVDGQISQKNTTSTQTTNFVVASIENTHTQAGTFETYLMKGTTTDGEIQDIYYSPEARIQVKELDYDLTGNLISSMELLEYHVAESANTLPIYWIALAIVGTAVAVSALGIIELKRRNSQKAASK